MNYLAVDTSGFHLTVIAKSDKGEHTYFNEDCALKHSVVLMDAIEQTLEKANMNVTDVDVFCCCLGPGSFTGIRIGVATVKAFAYALKKKALGVTSFDVLAYNKVSGKTLPLVDARHGHVYMAGYENKSLSIYPSFVSVEELEKYEDYMPIASSKIEGVEVEIVSLAEGFRVAVEENLALADEDIEKLYPLYIRKSQAEEGR